MPNDNDDTKKDLTRIEDLSEFLHPEDENIESLLDQHNSFTEIDSFDDELPPPVENILEENQPQDNFSFPNETEDSNSYFSSDSTPDSNESLEESFASDVLLDSGDTSYIESEFSDSDTSQNENEVESEEFSQDAHSSNEQNTDLISSVETTEDVSLEDYKKSHDKLDEIKNFANNFSYGAISKTGGNPPFSLKILNIKYQEDADDMISMLREFGIITPSNEKDYLTAFKLGAVLIPQINEYAAIVIAHKFRRFDCDIEVGLSDEIHPSKSGDVNPKGFLRKMSVGQNKKEKFTPSDNNMSIDDILSSTTSLIDGYEIKKNIGVYSVFSIITVEEMNRLHYVQKARRENNIDDDPETKDAFDAYEESFQKAYDNLLYELKVKAIKLNANALIGVSYQINPLNNESYNLVCSATFTYIESIK